MANTKVNPHNMKDPNAMAVVINATAGSTILTKYGVLDPLLGEKQVNAWVGAGAQFRKLGPLDRGASDPKWTPDGFSAACGLG